MPSVQPASTPVGVRGRVTVTQEQDDGHEATLYAAPCGRGRGRPRRGPGVDDNGARDRGQCPVRRRRAPALRGPQRRARGAARGRRTRRLPLDRAQGPDPGRVRRGQRRAPAPPPRGRGRGARPAARQGRDVRHERVRRPQAAALPRGDLGHRDGRAHVLRRRPLHRHRPAGRGQPLAGLRQRLEPEPDRMRLGPMAVLHTIVDSVVDTYTAIDEEIANDLEDIETEVFSGGPMDSTAIYRLKREVLEFRRAAVPLGPAADAAPRRAQPDRRGRAAAAPARRLRPPPGGHRPRRVLRPAAHRRARGAPRPDLGAAEQRHAQDLVLGRDRRRADDDRRHLRDELRVHARARPRASASAEGSSATATSSSSPSWAACAWRCTARSSAAAACRRSAGGPAVRWR